MQQELQKKIESIENEVKLIKTLIKIKGYSVKKPVSLRGIAKTKLNANKLDTEIEKSKKSLFSHEEV